MDEPIPRGTTRCVLWRLAPPDDLVLLLRATDAAATRAAVLAGTHGGGALKLDYLSPRWLLASERFDLPEPAAPPGAPAVVVPDTATSPHATADRAGEPVRTTIAVAAPRPASASPPPCDDAVIAEPAPPRRPRLHVPPPPPLAPEDPLFVPPPKAVPTTPTGGPADSAVWLATGAARIAQAPVAPEPVAPVPALSRELRVALDLYEQAVGCSAPGEAMAALEMLVEIARTELGQATGRSDAVADAAAATPLDTTRLVVAPPDTDDAPVLPHLRVAPGLLVVIGGVPIPQAETWLTKVVGGRVEWVRTDPHCGVRSTQALIARIHGAKIRGVVVVVGLIDHRACDNVRRACAARGVPIATVDRAGRGEMKRALVELESRAALAATRVAK